MTFTVDDIEEAAPPTDEQFKRVSDLAIKQVKTEDEVAKLEKDLKEKKAELNTIVTVDFPKAMADIRSTGWKMEDGSEVELIEVIRAGIKDDDNKPKALQYVRDLNWGDLIKTSVTVFFGKGEEKQAEAFKKYIIKTFPDQEREQSIGVHPQTLSAAVRAYMAADADKPPEEQKPLNEEAPNLLGIFRQRMTKITRPKPKKSKTKI